MSDFKVGDKVRCVSRLRAWFTEGHVYEVSYADKYEGVCVTDDDGDMASLVFAGHFEKIEPEGPAEDRVLAWIKKELEDGEPECEYDSGYTQALLRLLDEVYGMHIEHRGEVVLVKRAR